MGTAAPKLLNTPEALPAVSGDSRSPHQLLQWLHRGVSPAWGCDVKLSAAPAQLPDPTKSDF